MWAAAAVERIDRRAAGQELDRTQRITLNFHPDRATARGLLTIEALALDGLYRSQFETGTSNGGLTAHRGGTRWQWENQLFDGAYDDAPAAERPKYGALNHRRRALGGAPRFGSAHFRLVESALDRATFCFPDSAMNPTDFATARHFDLLRLADRFDRMERDPAVEPEEGDLLDGYIEAQVHGVVELATDVAALVLDPCYRGTFVEEVAQRLPVELEWHEGRILTVGELSRRAYYRDPGAQRVGLAIARDGILDARIVGEASRTGRFHAQDLKQVWHLIARFGQPTFG